MIFLAESSWTAPTGVASAIAILFFLAAGLNQLFKLRRNVVPDQHPPNASLDQRVTVAERDIKRVEEKADVTANRLAALDQRIVENGDKRKKDIEGKLNDVRLELKVDIKEVREKSQEQHEAVLLAIGELKGKVQ